MKTLIKYFLRGLVIVIPIAVTIYVIVQLFVWIDRLLGLERTGAGFLIVIAGTTLVGLLASNILLKKLFQWTEVLFVRAPLVKIIYTSIRDLIEAFVGEKKRFTRPVVVSMGADCRVLGFITQDDMSTFGLASDVAVYLPQSYNFAGNLLIVPRTSVAILQADSSKVMAFIVSGGVSGGTVRETASRVAELS